MRDWRDVPVTLSFAKNKWANAFNDHRYTPRRLVEEKLSKHHVLPEKGLYGFSCELINDSERVNEAGARKGKNLRNDNPDNAYCISPVCRLWGALHDALEAYLQVLDGWTLDELVLHRGRLANRLGAH